MAAGRRRTAVLTIVFGDTRPGDLRALDVQREYRFDLGLDGRLVAGGAFRSPLGDEEWRGVIDKLREATGTPRADVGELRRARERVEGAGVLLHRCLRQLSPQLERFLADRSRPRRLVIKSDCPEIHRLPWEALLDDTVRPWQSPAEADLSIVRATDVFDDVPVAVPPPLKVRAVFGPGTERRTLDALKVLTADGGRRREARVEVRTEADVEDAGDGDLVHVEAHGDLRTGEADVGRESGFESTLADRLRGRRMVLLWSCHSGFVHSWGESLAMTLHRQANGFVLAFTTPLRFETSAELAAGFYARTFVGPGPADPETAVVRERLRLYREREPACEWAALTLWLQAPLDLSAVTLEGPRILPAPDRAVGPEPALERLARVLQEAVPGRPVPVPELRLSGGLPSELVEGYRGAVVHLRADDPAGEMAPALEGLAVRAPSVHRADRFLAVFDRLGAYPDSLLVWSGVSARELDALRLLEEFPRTLTIVLTSPFRIGVWEARGAAPAPSEPADPLAQLEATLDSGQHERAHALWQALHRAGGPAPDSPDFLRLQIAGYWTLARLGRLEDAARCVVDVKRLDPVEGLLLEGNLGHRRGRYDVAGSRYAEASRRARDACDDGRATLERAYLADESGDPELAERFYLDAVRLLEGTTDRGGDSRWASALGRALRDYAGLLAGRPERVDETAPCLRRALMIHALDGRMNQVGAALKTRATLERARQRWARAEDALLAAASALFECRNLVGWAEAMADLAELGAERGHFRQTLAIAAAVGPTLAAGQGRRVHGRIALVAARAAWRLGEIDEAVERSREAVECLSQAPEGILARNLHAALASLRGWPA